MASAAARAVLLEARFSLRYRVILTDHLFFLRFQGLKFVYDLLFGYVLLKSGKIW